LVLNCVHHRLVKHNNSRAQALLTVVWHTFKQCSNMQCSNLCYRQQ